MHRDYKFKEGQQVQSTDLFAEEAPVAGRVTDITRDTVFILWSNSSEPQEHPRTEFPLIQLKHAAPNLQVMRLTPGRFYSRK